MNLKNITRGEYEELLKFPAYVSLLAANTDGELDHTAEISAVEFAHMKTYSCDPLLRDFYSDVDNNFKATLETLNKSLPSGKANRETEIKNKLLSLDESVLKLGDEFSLAMHRSMKSFKEHVSQAHHNVLIDFLFPIPIKGLSYFD